MKLKKKWLALISTVAMAAAVVALPGNIKEVNAAAPSVNSAVQDVTANVGDVVSIPITFSSTDDLKGVTGKLNGGYDTAVLEFQGIETPGLPNGMTSTAGGNFTYFTTSTFKSGTVNLKFKVLKCSANPVTVKITDLYYSTATEASVKETLTSKVTINHPADKRAETITKAPTCTEKGIKTITCTACGATLGTAEIGANGHTPGEWQIKKEATCKEKGLKELYCTVCQELIDTDEIPLKDHSWDEGEVTKEASCSEEGVKTFTCTKCQDTKTEKINKLPHTWKVDENTDKDGWKVVKEATKDEEGSKVRVCEVCGEKETAVIPKLSAQGTNGTGTAGTGTTGTGTGTKVQTGDTTTIFGLIALFAAAAACIAAVVVKRRKMGR